MPVNFQTEITEYLIKYGVKFNDFSRFTSMPDIQLFKGSFKGHREHASDPFYLELKEKTRYKASNWPVDIPERHLFICDDLTIRKLLRYAPDSAMAIRNNGTRKMHVLLVVDFLYLPKARVNRPIYNNQGQHKGKWLFDLRAAKLCHDIHGIFWALRDYLRNKPTIYRDHTACWGCYFGEDIGEGGVLRTDEHRQHDLDTYK